MVLPQWESWDVLWGNAWNMAWRLTPTPERDTLPINATRLEYYVITQNMPSFYTNIVPVKLLQCVVLARSHDVMRIEHCIRQAFTDFVFAYDAVRGEPFYTAGIGYFKLDAYLDNIGKGALVNRYDQAGMM
jgi:hypothetical protein